LKKNFWDKKKTRKEHFPVLDCDIDLGPDHFPIFKIFVNELLEETAEEVAADPIVDKDEVPEPGGSGRINTCYDSVLLQAANDKIGKWLTEDQKQDLRDYFKEKVHSGQSEDPIKEIAEKIVVRLHSKDEEYFKQDFRCNDKHIPREYDGVLLHRVSQQKKKRLSQKIEARIKLREEVERLERERAK